MDSMSQLFNQIKVGIRKRENFSPEQKQQPTRCNFRGRKIIIENNSKGGVKCFNQWPTTRNIIISYAGAVKPCKKYKNSHHSSILS